MEQNTDNVITASDSISEKLRDTAELNKFVKQAVVEAVEKARKLGFLPKAGVREDAAEYKAK